MAKVTAIVGPTSTTQSLAEQAVASGAAAQVLDLPELLETVLLSLNITTLFKLQRVNKRFQHVIAESRRIQMKMFLIEDPSSTLNDKDNVNPLIDLGRTVFKEDWIFIRESEPFSKPFDTSIPSLRTFRHTANPFPESFDISILTESNILHHSSHESWRKTRLLAGSRNMRAGSMMILDPSHVTVKNFTLENHEDLTLGQLADSCHLIEQEPPDSTSPGRDTKDQLPAGLQTSQQSIMQLTSRLLKGFLAQSSGQSKVVVSSVQAC
ncbi:hypothetical protein LTR37_014285 [Vermiconidia calcicola]|uniref:Uncharacterized protein n=1 Tax=Vermiconidia calcicola TaxID=1690605 RepID=A0ACC3MWU4_9PEZI|nr:hypothetical protein LTR37_014285 [Vermiconidia calcicola]